MTVPTKVAYLHFGISNLKLSKMFEMFLKAGSYLGENFKTLLLSQLWSLFNQTFSKCSLWHSSPKLSIGILKFEILALFKKKDWHLTLWPMGSKRPMEQNVWLTSRNWESLCLHEYFISNVIQSKCSTSVRMQMMSKNEFVIVFQAFGNYLWAKTYLSTEQNIEFKSKLK